jgi:uncharacterized protein
MLIIDLRRLDSGSVRTGAHVAPEDALWTHADVEFLRPFHVDVTTTRTGEQSCLVRGRFDAALRGYCRRCLKPLELEIAQDVELFFEPLKSLDEEDLDVYHLDPLATELDLSGPLREQFLLSVPAYPVCREDCRGLCPGCGADLNVEACRCSGESTDPRWAPLRALGR